MYQLKSSILGKKNLFNVFGLLFAAIFTVGGCNDGGNGVGVNGSDTSACTVLSEPCGFISETGGIVECVLSDTTCVVDLGNIIGQLQDQNINVSDSSILYIGAWGGDGGSAAENGGGSSDGGYTQTTTTVSDIVSLNNGSSLLYYFLGEPGGNAPGHCGGGGGASTILTFEDLTLNPSADPSLGPLYMIAGGGGGAGGGTIKGCINIDGPGGARGGITIAPESATPGLFFNAGAGCNGTTDGCGTSECVDQCQGKVSGVFLAEGGGGNQSAQGGQRICCTKTDTKSQNGLSGIGGLGGAGGQGVNCTAVQAAGFRNASLSFGTGQGGSGGGGTNNCTSGGGGGGGGYGGGGGAGHGDNNVKAQAGGGGGSAAMSSTQDTSSSPAAMQKNPCGTSGCVAIHFFED